MDAVITQDAQNNISRQTWHTMKYDTDLAANRLVKAFPECKLPLSKRELCQKAAVPPRTFYRKYNSDSQFWEWFKKKIKVDYLQFLVPQVLAATAKRAIKSAKYGRENADLFLSAIDEDYQNIKIKMKQAQAAQNTIYNVNALQQMSDEAVMNEIQRLGNDMYQDGQSIFGKDRHNEIE